MIRLAENKYGKSRVRLVQVKRHADRHDFRDWTLEILLQGDFETCFTEGDNSKILPTDTMKNTVYTLARDSAATCPEEFAKELIAHFLQHNPQASAAEIVVSEKPWEHLQTAGKPHPTTFVQSSSERQITEVSAKRGGSPTTVRSGFDNLIILKTAHSAFEGFLRDKLTTLPETGDRLFGTAASARWTYSAVARDYAALRARIRETLLDAFAAHNSKSVQHTLYAMGEAALNGVAEIDDIDLSMPNIHCLLVDLSRFGQDNPNEIFVPIDEPHGTIQARLRRS